MDRYDRTALLRQQVLDYANEKGQVRSCEVVRHFKLNVDHAYRTLRKMEAKGELEGIGKGTSLYFKPLRTQTTSAEEMRQLAYNQIKKGHQVAKEMAAARKVRKTNPNWLTVNNDPDRPPIRNQGGQGNIRAKVGVQSCADWV